MEEKFNFVKRGYDPTEVNTYIDTLEKVLTSYKEKDNAIKNALINAQIAAENIVKNAELEADKIVAKALLLIDTISGSLQEQKQFVQAFQDEYNLLIGKYLRNFNDADIQKIYAKINELEDYVVRIKGSAPITNEESVTGILPEMAATMAFAEAPAPQPAPQDFQQPQQPQAAPATPPVMESPSPQANEGAAAPEHTSVVQQLKKKLF